jgi:hypothetical protein
MVDAPIWSVAHVSARRKHCFRAGLVLRASVFWCAATHTIRCKMAAEPHSTSSPWLVFHSLSTTLYSSDYKSHTRCVHHGVVNPGQQRQMRLMRASSLCGPRCCPEAQQRTPGTHNALLQTERPATSDQPPHSSEKLECGTSRRRERTELPYDTARPSRAARLYDETWGCRE